MTIQEQIYEIAEELTHKDKFTNGYRWAPALRMLGDKLKLLATDYKPHSIRPDVLAFATKMSTILDLKDGEKGAAMALPVYVALEKVEAQLRKFGEAPAPSNIETRRALIHIANFVMLAEKKLP